MLDVTIVMTVLDTIDLIDKKTSGIISLLDEEGKVPKGTNEGFLGRLDKQHSRNIAYQHHPKVRESPHPPLEGSSPQQQLRIS